MVRIPQVSALALLPRLRDPNQCAAAEGELQKMVETKKAHLLGWPELTVVDRQRGFAESLQEYRYPTSDVLASEVTTLSGRPPSRPEQRAAAAWKAAGFAIPDAMETRYAGASLSVTCGIAPGTRSTTVEARVTSVELPRFIRFGFTPKGVDLKTGIPQPVFATHNISATLSLEDRERRLLYVGTDSEHPEEVVIFTMGVRLTEGVGSVR